MNSQYGDPLVDKPFFAVFCCFYFQHFLLQSVPPQPLLEEVGCRGEACDVWHFGPIRPHYSCGRHGIQGIFLNHQDT